MSRTSFSRRALLQALTVGAGSLAFGGASPFGGLGRVARANTPNVPKRLIVFPIANGVSDYPDFGTAGASPTQFTLGPMLKPIETLGLRDQLVCLDNIEMKRTDQNFDTHFAGMTQVLTGPTPTQCANQISQHVSLDNYAAKTLSANLPFSTLYMGTMCDSMSYSYLDNGQSVPNVANPLDVYKRVFANLGSTGPDAALLRRLVRRQSVLDGVSKDLSAFASRLPAEDKVRADAQLAAIQALEKQLASQMSGNVSCGKPTIDNAIDYKSDQNVPQTMRAFIDLTVAALACDQTRVVMFHSYAREYHPPYANCPWAPVGTDYPAAGGESYHGLSHNAEGSPNYAAFKEAKGFHFQLAGELANKLKAIPEPSATGTTMLDHTLIFLPSEIGRGHTPAGLQFATLGGKGLGVKTGQYLQLGTTRDIGAGVAHQRLLVAILNALGIMDTTFGEEGSSGSGPLGGYLA